MNLKWHAPPSSFRVGTVPSVTIHLGYKAPFFHSYWADKARRRVKLLTRSYCLSFKPWHSARSHPSNSRGLPDSQWGRGETSSLTPSGWGTAAVHSANIYQLLFTHQGATCQEHRRIWHRLRPSEAHSPKSREEVVLSAPGFNLQSHGGHDRCHVAASNL